MVKTELLTIGILVVTVALAGTAIAQEDGEVVCPSTPEEAEQVAEATACVTDEADDGDPTCEEPGSNYYATTGGEIEAEGQGLSAEAKAAGTESCRHTTGWFSDHDGYQEFDGSVKVCSGAECQWVGFDWRETWDEDPEDTECSMSVWTQVVGEYVEVPDDVYEEADSDEVEPCPAGSPPNPGWGSVLP